MTALALLIATCSISPCGSLHAVRVTEAPVIDGLLDDAVWQQADMEHCTMWQYGPDYGAPMTEDTDFYVLYDDSNIYMGFLMYDPDQDSMMEGLTPRDNYITGEWMAVLIDTWNDGREATSFEVSLANSQMESKINPYGGWDYSWDAVWRSATSRVPEGWSAEFAIPFSCLRFADTDSSQTWGVNFQRILSRTSENGWYMLTECNQMADLSTFAPLTGLCGLSGSLGMELRPYGSGRAYRSEAEEAWDDTWEAGVDLKLGVSSGITADFTLNPDFGQVEADAAEMNLSHFELFLQDRRPFFLESRNIFEMPFNMFYSRRIGAVAPNGDVIPIIGGAKVSGSFGDGFRFGFLDAVTSRVWEDTTIAETAANYGVFRGYRQFGSRSYLGVSAVSRESWEQESVPGQYSRALALDGAVELPGSHLLEASVAGSWNTGMPGDGACSFAFHRIRSTFSYDLGGSWVGESFDVNATGYTTETGYYEGWGGVWKNFRPREVFSEIGFGGNVYYSQREDGEVTGRNVHFETGASLKNNLRFGAEMNWSGSRFDPYEGPDGHRYGDALDFFVDGGTSPFDPFSVWFGIGGGQWASEGTFDNYMGNVRFRPSPALELRLEGQLFRTRDTEYYNWDPDVAAFDTRSTDWKSLILRMNYMFSPSMNLRLFSQYSEFMLAYEHSPRSESSELQANALLSWEYRPGSMLYLLSETVFPGNGDGGFEDPDYGFYAKLTWYLAM